MKAYAIAGIDARLGRRSLVRDHVRHVVLDAVDQGFPVGRQAKPAAIRRNAGDEGAASLLALDQPFLLQDIHGLADGDARDLKFGLELFQGRDLVAGRPATVFDPLPQGRRDLHVERRAAALVGLGEVMCWVSSHRSDQVSIVVPSNARRMAPNRPATHTIGNPFQPLIRLLLDCTVFLNLIPYGRGRKPPNARAKIGSRLARVTTI
jgi:hypothetical protein